MRYVILAAGGAMAQSTALETGRRVKMKEKKKGKHRKAEDCYSF